MLLSCFKPANGSGLARIQDCPNSHVSKTSDNCDIGVSVLVLEVSFRMKIISSPYTYISLVFFWHSLYLIMTKQLFNILCKSWKQAARVAGPGNRNFRTKTIFLSCLPHFGSILFRTSAYTGAKQASRVPFWFRDLSRQNHLVPGHLVPFFRPDHLVPLFGSPRPIFYNGF